MHLYDDIGDASSSLRGSTSSSFKTKTLIISSTHLVHLCRICLQIIVCNVVSTENNCIKIMTQHLACLYEKA